MITISAFPGTGKSFAAKSPKLLAVRFIDLDSTPFSKLKNGEQNPEFPSNYIKDIKSCRAGLFISSHKIVRDALIKEFYPFFLLYPDISLKDEYLSRYKNRGSDQKFIDLLDKSWESWITEIEEEKSECITKVRMRAGEFVLDLMDDIFKR